MDTGSACRMKRDHQKGLPTSASRLFSVTNGHVFHA